MQFHHEHFHSYVQKNIIFIHYIKWLVFLVLITDFLIFLYHRSQFNPSQTFPNQAQWNASGTDNDFEMTSGPMTSTSGQVPKVNNHQKTAERMAEDESA